MIHLLFSHIKATRHMIIYEMAKTRFSENEALEYCFEQIKPTLLPSDLYNKFNSYRMRYKAGTLGIKAKDAILKHYGFTLIEVKKTYRKES